MRCPVVVGLLLSACVFGCSGEEESAGTAGSVEWKFALEEIQGSVQDAYAQKFKELVEQRTQGKVKVTVYPYGTLGTSDQITELVQNGAVQFAMASPGHLGKVIPAAQVLLLHFVFSSDNEVNQTVLGESNLLRDHFDRLYRPKGLKFLALYPEGWQVWTTRKAIRKPEDFAGVKMRVMTSPILIEAYEAYGASPTPLPYGEVYSALQLKMIDGQVNPIFAIEEMSFHEVTDYLIFARQAQFVTSVVTNPEFFDGLPEHRQRMIREIVAELTPYIFDVQERYNLERLRKIKEEKPEIQIIQLTEEERDAFRRASLPVREKFVDMVGSDGASLLDLLTAEIRRVEKNRTAEQTP